MIKYLRIKGRVQGVGFRFWAARKAYELGISGFVYNDESGDVLVCLSADEDKITQMMAYLYNGPLFARVDSIEPEPMGEYLFPKIENGVFKRL